MSAIITLVISMLGQLIPAIGSNSTLIASIIDGLIQLVPLLTEEYQALQAPVKNIIEALSANPATSASQLATLQALDLQVDQAFDSAATAAQTEDATVGTPSS